MASRVGLLGAALLLLVAARPAVAQERGPDRRIVPDTTVEQQGPTGERADAPARTRPSQERSCRQVLPSDARRLFNARGQELIYFRDPVRVLCTGGLRLEADSAVMNRTVATVELVGDVVYRDSLRELTADWANYLGQRDQLLARGSVVLRNVEDGSMVEGEELDYLQANEQRPLALMLVRGGRPHAVIPPQPDSAGGVPDTAVSTEVWADRMRFEGEEVFSAVGDVEIERGEMTGAGGTALFDQREEQMTLTGEAFVQTDRYRLDGQQIVAFLSGQELRTITSEVQARVESEELTVESDRIRIGFVDGRLDRMQAWNPRGDSVPRALADARDFRLRADSIDALADSVGIQEVRAVGRAYGERNADPTVRSPTAVSRDWIQGDTILGYFAHEQTRRPPGRVTPVPDRVTPVPDRVTPADMRLRPLDTVPDGGEGLRTDPASDSAAAPESGDAGPAPGPQDSVETVLERIVVIGGQLPALSLYRMPAEQPGDPPSINFLKANRITLYMADGDVTRVDAEGPLDGLYLAPSGRAVGEENTAGEGEDGAEPSAPDVVTPETGAPDAGPETGSTAAGPGGGT